MTWLMVINALDDKCKNWHLKTPVSRDWRKRKHSFFQCGYNNLERLSTFICSNLRLLLKEIPKLGDRGQTASWIKEIKGTIVCLCLHFGATGNKTSWVEDIAWYPGEKISPRGSINQKRIDLYKATSNNILFTLLLNAIQNGFVLFT